MNNHITCLSLSFSRRDLSSINLFWINNFESNLSKLENFFPSFQQSAYIYLRFEYNIYEILSSLQAKRRFYLVLFEKFRNMRKHLDTSSERLKISRIVLELDFRWEPRGGGFHPEMVIGNYYDPGAARGQWKERGRLTLWYLQNATIMGRQTPGAGFFSSTAGGARSVTATIFV